MQVRALSQGPEHHFFGYFGINPWSNDGQSHLALSVARDDLAPRVGDTAEVGLIDKQSGLFRKLTTSSGWNLQQGCMAHWVQFQDKECISINDLKNECCVTRILDTDGYDLANYEQGLCAVTSDGRRALSLDFARMYHCRKVVGYAVSSERASVNPAPTDAGIWHLDLNSGERRLIVSIAEVIKQSGHCLSAGSIAWFNHAIFSPDDQSIVFVCRHAEGHVFHTSLWTIKVDGTELHMEIPFGGNASHFCWLDAETIIVSTDNQKQQTMRFMSVKRGRGMVQEYGADILVGDSHLCFSPDRSWALADRYPNAARLSDLFLFNPKNNKRVDIGSFHHPSIYSGDIRCDLHPRWSADGNTITFDSVHEGTRQIYVVCFDRDSLDA